MNDLPATSISARRVSGAVWAAVIVGLGIGLVIAGSLAYLVWKNIEADRKLALSARYYAVLLSNGQAYFGQIEFAGDEFVVLNDVYYVQSRVDAETSARSSSLVRRGAELHGPDRMFVNRDHVVFIEPVGYDSRIARLIAESKRKP